MSGRQRIRIARCLDRAAQNPLVHPPIVEDRSSVELPGPIHSTREVDQLLLIAIGGGPEQPAQTALHLLLPLSDCQCRARWNPFDRSREISGVPRDDGAEERAANGCFAAVLEVRPPMELEVGCALRRSFSRCALLDGYERCRLAVRASNARCCRRRGEHETENEASHHGDRNPLSRAAIGR